jgi:hypothetical protein
VTPGDSVRSELPLGKTSNREASHDHNHATKPANAMRLHGALMPTAGNRHHPNRPATLRNNAAPSETGFPKN